MNPLKFDWQQRLSLFIAISAFAYFLAHTIYRPKASAATDSEQRIGFLENQLKDIQSQQAQTVAQQEQKTTQNQQRQAVRGQLAEFLKQGKTIQHDIQYNSGSSLQEKEAWERRIGDYLVKNLDQSYAIRFQNPSHQVLAYPSGMSVSMMGPWADIGAKMAMLNDFISELRD